MSSVRSTEFQTILDIALEDKGLLPNVAEIEHPIDSLKKIGTCMGKIYVPYSFKIYENERAYYPKIFTHTGGMASRFDGAGVILTTQGKGYSFFMCEHEWNESGANHSRGWHPKRCTKCGFDASIDSGD